MDAKVVAAILHATYTYWVEIQYLDEGRTDWVHIHCPDWETTKSCYEARLYAIRVRKDHPGAQVRIVERADALEDHHIPMT